MSFFLSGGRDSAPRQKGAKRKGFVACRKNDGRRGMFEEDMGRHILRGRRVQEAFSSEMLGRQGADFLRGVAFRSIRSSGLLR